MSAALEVLRAAQEGDRDACEQAVLENNGLIWSVVRRRWYPETPGKYPQWSAPSSA